jgi:hypothetical protein
MQEDPAVAGGFDDGGAASICRCHSTQESVERLLRLSNSAIDAEPEYAQNATLREGYCRVE